MTISLPVDHALPNLERLAQPGAMVQMIASAISSECRSSVIGCVPTYVRYKPGTSCLVQYELRIAAPNDDVVTRIACVKVFADDRAERRAGSRKSEKMEMRAADRDECCDLPGVLYLDDVRGYFQLFPIDYDLPFLVKATKPGAMASRFVDAGLLETGNSLPEPTLIRYKPGRKALLRYQLPLGAIYGKLHLDDRSEQLANQTQALIDAGLPTPPVVMTLPEHGFLAHAEYSGAPLASLRESDGYADLMGPMADLLQQLHSIEIPGGKVHTLVDEMAALRGSIELLGTVLPELRDRFDRLGDRIEAKLAYVSDVLVTNHGDFYDDQILVAESGMTMIDLDELRVAHPLLDTGNFLAHLRSGAARGERIGDATSAFVKSTRMHQDWSDEEIALFESIGLLKLAPGPFRRLEDEWPKRTEQILELAERCLDNGGGDGGHGSKGVVDSALPQMDDLQNDVVMSARLSDYLHGELQHIEVIRHKPGRRAILRYTSSTGAELYGKTFASKRGPKVYEITRRITEAQAFGDAVTLPKPVGYWPNLKLLLQESVPGTAITPRLCAGDSELAERIAEAIHTFHTSGVDLGREHSFEKELSPLESRASEVGEIHGELRELADECLSKALSQDISHIRWDHVPAHRDFYHDQVMEEQGRLAILDLDDATMSDPMVDVANFSAHLTLLSLQQPDAEQEVNRVREAFVDRYRALSGGIEESLFRYLTGTTLLRLAGIHAPRANGFEVASGLLTRARAAFDR